MPLSLQYQAASLHAVGSLGKSTVTAAGLQIQRPWSCSSYHSRCASSRVSCPISFQGLLQNAICKGPKEKHWIVQSSNADQSEEILEEAKVKLEENKGPPVLTIIAGLLVVLVCIWALGSLVSFVVGLIFR